MHLPALCAGIISLDLLSVCLSVSLSLSLSLTSSLCYQDTRPLERHQTDLAELWLSRIGYCTVEADRISFSFSFSAPKNAFFLFFGLLFFGRKRCTYFRCILFFGINMAVKIPKTVSALTQLTHEGPRSTVNFSQHVQPQSALSTNIV